MHSHDDMAEIWNISMMAGSAFVIPCITLDIQCKVYSYEEYQESNHNKESHKHGTGRQEHRNEYDREGRYGG